MIMLEYIVMMNVQLNEVVLNMCTVPIMQLMATENNVFPLLQEKDCI